MSYIYLVKDLSMLVKETMCLNEFTNIDNRYGKDFQNRNT